MNKQRLEYICDQISSMQEAFDTLKDNCYHLNIELKKEMEGLKDG